MIKITLKDGSIKEVEEGKSVFDVAKEISEGLARVATCAVVDGKVVDLRYILNNDCNLEIHTFESSLEGKKAYWHTSSHKMAQNLYRLRQRKNRSRNEKKKKRKLTNRKIYTSKRRCYKIYGRKK